MCDNIRAAVVELPQPTDPNWKSSSIITQRIYPVTSIIDGNNQISGNLQFEWTVPSGYRQLCDRTQILFDMLSAITGKTTTTVTSQLVPNFPAAFFSTGRFELNDYLVSQSNNVPADDTMFKRLINSRVKNITSNSGSMLYGTDAERLAYWATVTRQGVSWKPDCLISNEAILPSNVKCRIILTVNPNLNTAANCPATCSSVAGGAGDDVLRFYSIYLVNTYVKVDQPTPKTVYIPAYSINSSYQIVNGTNFNGQWSVPKDTYKIVIALQSNASTVAGGQAVTKFSSGSGSGAQNAYSLYLTSLQMRYGNATYPSTAYQIVESGTQQGSIEPYVNYVANTEGYLDPAGSEAYADWADPVTTADKGLGRLFVFSLVKPANSSDTTAEIMSTFSTGPTTTRMIVFSLIKCAIGITYHDNGQVMEIRSVPYQ